MNDSDSVGERIKRAREDKGWSHKKLAQELLSCAQSPSSVDSVKRNIIRWENDEHRVGRDFSAALAAVLGVEVDPSEILTKMNERRRGVEKMMSRSGLKRRDWSSEQHSELYENVCSLARAYLSQPIYKIYKDMADLQDRLAELKDRVIVNYQPDIYFWLSIVMGIFANAGHDLGQPRMAIAYAGWARDLAAETGCAPLQAWTFGMLSLIEYRWSPGDQTHLSKSVEYAEDGVRLLGRTMGTTSVWLQTSEARAKASLGDVDGALAAIYRAERARENVRDDELDAYGGICRSSEAENLYYICDAFTSLESHAIEGQRRSVEAINAYQDPASPDFDFGCLACSRTSLAIARVRLNELDGADEAIRPVFELEPAKRIQGVIQSVEKLYRALQDGPSAPLSRDLMANIVEFKRSRPRIDPTI